MKLLGKSTNYTVGVPIVQHNSEIYFEICDAEQRLENALIPANTSEILKLLAGLYLHFPGVKMSEREFAVLLDDYVQDLAIYPFDILE